ncbi:hypothetical protein ACJX0J_025112, partial [Zea mays]
MDSLKGPKYALEIIIEMNTLSVFKNKKDLAFPYYFYIHVHDLNTGLGTFINILQEAHLQKIIASNIHKWMEICMSVGNLKESLIMFNILIYFLQKASPDVGLKLMLPALD